MKRLKTFAHRVWISATAPASYAQFLKQNFSAGVKYLYALLLTISAFWVIFGLIAFSIAFPTLRGAFAEIREELPGFYPQELVVTLKDGEISTNVREPYFIDVPKRWEKILAGSYYKHFVAFDTCSLENIRTRSACCRGVVVGFGAASHRQSRYRNSQIRLFHIQYPRLINQS